jgi:integrase/recombinase XerC
MRSVDESRDRALRRRAEQLGLRVRKHGHVYELRNNDGLVLSGTYASVAAYTVERCPRRKPGKPAWVRPPAEWAPMIEDYLTTLAAAGQPSTTIKTRRQSIGQMARELGAHPAEVTGEQLVAWLGRHTEWAMETRRNARTASRRFFLWAYKTGRIPAHIADDLPVVRERVAPARPVPDHAWQQALLAATPRVAIMLRLAAEAGLRRGEVAVVHTQDLVDGIDGAQLLVHGKAGKQRVIPISDSLAAAIRVGAAGHTPGMSSQGWLFPNGTGAHLSVYQVGDLVRQVLPEGYSMHKLRHRFASRAYRGSRNLRAIQELLGHSSIATTERYLAVDDQEIRAAMLSAL